MILWTIIKGLFKITLFYILLLPAIILSAGGDNRLDNWIMENLI